MNDNENINNNDYEIKNKIRNIINNCNDFLMSFNYKDFILIYYSNDKMKNTEKNKKTKFLENIQSLSFKTDNITNYFKETKNNFELYYVIICFIGIKKIANKLQIYLKEDFKLIKYLYNDKLNNLIQLIDDFISGYDINNISGEYQEIFFEDQINYVIEKYDDENNNINNLDTSNLIYQNSIFIQKLFIKEDIEYNEIKPNLKEKDNEENINKNLFNDKIQNIEDNLDDFISNLTNLYKTLSSYNESSPLLFNPLSFKQNDLEILYINLLQFCNICITIFYSITINGLGKEDQNQQEKSKPPPEDGKVYEGGYGMSDGAQGMENITKEIEDEEQLLGLRDENNNNNENNENKNEGENKDDEDNAFEMKNDFKEDFNKEMNDEDENNERKDNSDVEREEDSVNNNDNNKMGDQDVQDDLSEEQKDEKDKKKLDLTDKNVQIEQENKNKNNKYKEGDDEKDNEKNQNVDEDKEQGENENEENEKENKNEEDSSEQAEKIEKLDVDKNKEKK